MSTLSEQIETLELLHEEYRRELEKLSVEQKSAIKEFLDGVRDRKIAELKAFIAQENI